MRKRWEADPQEPVFCGPRGVLRAARDLLAAHDIPSRHSSPKRVEGTLRVSGSDAARARSVLAAHGFARGRVMSASEASWFFCHACRAPLDAGVLRCPACGAFVGDPHAL